jgi:hypothetical protein
MKLILALAAMSASVSAQGTPTTIHWGSWGEKCVNGKTVRTAVLYDIPWGKSWEDACASHPGYFIEMGAWVSRHATRCLNPWPHARMFGEWDTQDGC